MVPKPAKGDRDMKRKLLLALIASLSLTGCSTVSQDEYDLQSKELTTLQSEYDAKSKELENSVKELSEVQKELIKYKKEKTDKGFAESGGKAWAATSLGESAEVIVSNNNLYINIPTGYTISEVSISSLWDKVYSALTQYSEYYNASPQSLPYDSVTIIVLNEETGLDMLSFQFLKNDDGTFKENSTMVNLLDSQTIIPFLSKAIETKN